VKWRVYPAYKDSGVEWLGETPEHWEVIRVKAIEGNSAEVVQTGPFGAQLHAADYVDDGVPLILIRNIANLRIDDANIPRISHEDAERLSMYRLEIGDIVFSRVGSIGRIALCTEQERGWLISGQTLRLRMCNPKLDSKFSLYAFSSSAVLTFVDLQSVGSTRGSINTDILRNMPLPIPPLPEQHAIAAFLDRETARIDALIEKKERQIKLLEEKRAALISHAVTKGLDPDVPMKESGVEWLGEIPEGWQVIRIGFVAKVGNGSTPSRTNLDYWSDGDIPWLTSGKINEGVIKTADEFVTTKAMTECHLPKVSANSVLVAITGEGKTRGMSALLKETATISQHLAYITGFDNRVTAEFLRLYLMSQYNELRRASAGGGSTRAAITCEFLRYYPAIVPPVDEQRRITGYIDEETNSIDSLIGKVQTSIGFLREYRTALISAAVTGKIDVRRQPGATHF